MEKTFVSNKQDNLPQCELCGTDWFDETNDSLIEDYESIDENKRCVGCYAEWGDEYPDRV